MKEFAERIRKSTGGTFIFSLGQAGFIVKNRRGTTVAIDPYLSDYTERIENNIGFKRLLPKILGAEELEFDAVITTHEHSDHFDYDSMEALTKNGKTKLIASTQCRELAEEIGINKYQIIYVSPGDIVDINEIRVNIVDCDHGKSAPDAVGVILETDGKSIYETGDTCLREDIAISISRQFKNIDVLIGPINGKYGNMNESDFIQLISIINPNIAIPCHYGMFSSHGGDL